MRVPKPNIARTLILRRQVFFMIGAIGFGLLLRAPYISTQFDTVANAQVGVSMNGVSGDDIPPAITFLIPQNEASTKQETQVFSALISDPHGSGVATSSATWTILPGGQSGKIIPTGYGWLAYGTNTNVSVPLLVGQNSMRFTANDNAGNITTSEIKITRTLPTFNNGDVVYINQKDGSVEKIPVYDSQGILKKMQLVGARGAVDADQSVQISGQDGNFWRIKFNSGQGAGFVKDSFIYKSKSLFTQEILKPRLNDLTQEWVKEKDPLLKNFLNMYNGDVVVDESATDGYRYKMWFFGWASTPCNGAVGDIKGYPGCDATYYARSKDSNVWEVYAGDNATGSPTFDLSMDPKKWVPVVMARDTDSSVRYFDAWHNGDPSVVKVGAYYFMAYSASGFDIDGAGPLDANDADGYFSAIAGAVSTDGIHWTKKSSPLLAYRGEAGAWFVSRDSSIPFGSYSRPSLMYEDGKFKLWFDYYIGGREGGLGYAERAIPADPSTFLRGQWSHSCLGASGPKQWKLLNCDDNPQQLMRVGNAEVIKAGGLYYLYADAGMNFDSPFSWQDSRIIEAVSVDGKAWEVRGHVEPEKDCDPIGVPEAYVEKDTIFLVYACLVGNLTPSDHPQNNTYHVPGKYDTHYYQLRRMSRHVYGAAVVQGFKVSRNKEMPTSLSVTMDSKDATTTNPYFFRRLAPGVHEITAAVPEGWRVGYTLCYNVITCHKELPVMNNKVKIYASDRGFIDLWWHYFKN